MVTGEATYLRREIPPEAQARLRRLRGLAWLLDRAVGAGDKIRFGLDPILGLIPGLGDWLGALLSLYVVYEAVRLGLPWSVIVRMLANVAVEAVVGAIPVAGDVFDFLWQANIRNLRLVDKHYSATLPLRPMRSIGLFLVVVALLVAGGTTVMVWLMVRMISSL